MLGDIAVGGADADGMTVRAAPSRVSGLPGGEDGDFSGTDPAVVVDIV